MSTRKSVFLCYPCGDLYQRGEDRCQSNIKSSTATAMRACNDLGYMAAVLSPKHDVFLRDYQTEGSTFFDMLQDLRVVKPDYVVLSTTNATIFSDIDIINRLKEQSHLDFKVVLKGAIFFNAPLALFDSLDITNINVFVGGEIEFIIDKIVDGVALSEIGGLYYVQNGKVIKSKEYSFCEDLDSLPFPKRSLMKNELYTRPDTGEPMATIQTARGCPSQCIYCLTPKISGCKVRKRSPQNVFDEIRECYDTYGIKNFFFKADTFTIDKEWVLELCSLIENSDLFGKIHYTANSRVKPISKEVLEAMKRTGCFTIAFGFETGSENTLKRIKKGTTLEDARLAMKLAKEVKLPVFGFFMIGFPWETSSDIKATKKFIHQLDPDFLEVHIALPFYGTELHDIAEQANLLNGTELGTDYFHDSSKGTTTLSNADLLKLRKRILLGFHLRPSYILRKFLGAYKNPKIIKNYFKFGFRLLKNCLT
ncbi:MAG: radical SAM protein [Lachnospiraceae bacterium]|nr:radical SAM protein [Lachnospiraceae bacterium]